MRMSADALVGYEGLCGLGLSNDATYGTTVLVERHRASLVVVKARKNDTQEIPGE